MLEGEDSSEGREGGGLHQGWVLQVVLRDVVVLGGVPLVGHTGARAVRGLGGRTPALLLRQGRWRVRLLPWG